MAIDEKDLLRAHISSEEADKKHPVKDVDYRANGHSSDRQSAAWRKKNQVEDMMIDLIDNKAALKKILPILERLDAGKMDVTTALQKASKLAFAEGLKLLFLSQSDKVKADLAKHFLALAGHTPTQKLELGRMDPETPKSALLAQLAGSKKDLEQAGIEVIDDRSDETDKAK